VGVAEICQAAGLTHGALYAQFPSKEALAAEALAQGLERSFHHMTAPKDDREPVLTDYLDLYLSRRLRDNLAGGCPMAASASEIARQDESLSVGFTKGFERTVEAIEAELGPTGSTATARQRALAVVAAIIGGVAMSRAVVKARPRLADDILKAVRQVVGEVGGERALRKTRARTRK
jgi:TetR/AcrR family transcriptional repressor of nem operon